MLQIKNSLVLSEICLSSGQLLPVVHFFILLLSQSFVTSLLCAVLLQFAADLCNIINNVMFNQQLVLRGITFVGHLLCFFAALLC